MKVLKSGGDFVDNPTSDTDDESEDSELWEETLINDLASPSDVEKQEEEEPLEEELEFDLATMSDLEVEIVDIPDENLKACLIEDGADLDGDGELSVAEMEELHSIDTYAYQVSDLTGLEYAVNLDSLFCMDDQITDLSPISGLESLRYLDVSRNELTDLTALSGCTGIENLYCSDNHITDLTPIASLRNLIYLDTTKFETKR